MEKVSELPFPGLLAVDRSVWGATYPGEAWALFLHQRQYRAWGAEIEATRCESQFSPHRKEVNSLTPDCFRQNNQKEWGSL